MSDVPADDEPQVPEATYEYPDQETSDGEPGVTEPEPDAEPQPEPQPDEQPDEPA